jgi:hypothetical protein
VDIDDYSLSAEKRIKAEQARQNNDRHGACEKEKPKWIGIAAQEFSRSKKQKNLTLSNTWCLSNLFDFEPKSLVR